MDNCELSVTWHSRAGQGAITAANALAEIIGELRGFNVQAFPDFGAEKRGAPVVVFNRLSSEPIHNVSHVKTPNVILLLDTSIISGGEKTYDDILDNLEHDGKLIMNTTQAATKFDDLCEGEIWHVDASGIAIAEIGKHVPNVPMLGAFIKATGITGQEEFAASLGKWLIKSLPKPVVDANIKAFNLGFEAAQKK